MFLVQRLTHDRRTALALLDDCERFAPIAPIIKQPSTLKYEDFKPAWTHNAYLTYLAGRGFSNPIRVCQQFNLRYAPAGTWAARLLLPLYDKRQLVAGWTGRSIRASLDPPYLAENTTGDLVSGVCGGRALVVVEGPIDALKINVGVGSQLSLVSAIGLNGKALTYDKINLIADSRPSHVLLCLDADVKPGLVWRTQAQIIAACRLLVPDVCVDILRVPNGYNDPGAMPEDQIIPWLLG